MMPDTTSFIDATTTDGYLLVLVIVLPVLGILLSLALGGKFIERITLALLLVGFCVAIAIFAAVLRSDQLVVYVVGNWQPPLGIALRADGISAGNGLTIAVIVFAIGLYARSEFGQQKGTAVTRSSYAFWTLLLGIWSGLNAVALGDDLFNLYVALELLTFAAVPLVCVKGYEATIKAAMRYMLFALIGSVLYLLGTALIYGTYGTLDITLLADRVRPEPAAWTAAALMTVGLLAKTALFPLHLWLPPAHAGAPAPGSAVLSALVVKGSFILIVRIWFDAMPGLLTFTAAQLLATLGAGAVPVRKRACVAAARLKLLVAYFDRRADRLPLLHISARCWRFRERTGREHCVDRRVAQLFSHAFAKTAMFMAAGPYCGSTRARPDR
jgi:formate hydrogenlyase subunit 3/multisubunit Na+/H+ antiporter MnhD subunit